MKKEIFLTVLFLASLAPGVSAEVIRGEIARVEERTLLVNKSVPTQTSTPEIVRIAVQADTQFQGVAFGELRPGDEISADVVKNEKAGEWAAKTIQLNKVNIQNEKEIGRENL